MGCGASRHKPWREIEPVYERDELEAARRLAMETSDFVGLEDRIVAWQRVINVFYATTKTLSSPCCTPRSDTSMGTGYGEDGEERLYSCLECDRLIRSNICPYCSSDNAAIREMREKELQERGEQGEPDEDAEYDGMLSPMAQAGSPVHNTGARRRLPLGDPREEEAKPHPRQETDMILECSVNVEPATSPPQSPQKYAAMTPGVHLIVNENG